MDIMTFPFKLAAFLFLLPALLAGCATYEATPTHATVTSYPYMTEPYYQVAPPVYYVTPAPIYVSPVPSFGAHVHSRPYSSRQSIPYRRDHRERGQPPRGRESGNAENARIGGPGWAGTVWSR